MKNNTTINNVTVNASANNVVVNKEDKDMMNLACTVEELKGMKRDVLRTAAQCLGIKGYSHMKKAELVEALAPFCKPELKVEVAEVETTAPVVPTVGVGYTINPLDDPEVTNLDVSDEALLQPVVETVEEKKEVVTMNNEYGKFEKLMKAVAKEIMFQTLPSKNGQLVVQKNEKGELVLLKFALFYRATKSVDCKDYMVVGKRLWGVIAKVIGELYGEKNKTSDYIQQTLDKMVEFNMITKVASERTYAVLNPATMNQDEKDQLNDLWRTKDIKTEKVEDKIKVTALTDNGKAVLNQLYPNYSYRATSAQMNKLYILSK